MLKKDDVKISKVLHLAADKYLEDCSYEKTEKYSKRRYSCSSIKEAIKNIYNCELRHIDADDEMAPAKLWLRIESGLSELGLKTESTNAYSDFHGMFEEIQGARYLWLKFCALMAEEQEKVFIQQSKTRMTRRSCKH